MIVATAGHVDHGKTSLIKQLTGVDTDRLEEEKRRGLSINLGFAYRKVDAQNSIGFIDVPGHKSFINTMISGVSGVDICMLVVAADDGVMPQTLEHLQVMRLLGVTDIVVVISKIDCVDRARIEIVRHSVAELLPQCQIFEVSNRVSETGANKSKALGQGVQQLQAFLDDQAQSLKHRVGSCEDIDGLFRMSIDRAFTLKGSGLVVTGTVTSGLVKVGDTVRLQSTASGDTSSVRVRSVHAQNEMTDVGHSGQRCALNIVGDFDKQSVHRGDYLSATACISPGFRFDARVQICADITFALKHMLPIKIYVGARRVAAKLFILKQQQEVAERGAAQVSERKLLANDNVVVQIVLQEALLLCRGDRFLIRDDSESMNLGGGTVLLPQSQPWRKNHGERLLLLSAMEEKNAFLALIEIVIEHQQSLDFTAFKLAWNMTEEQSDKLLLNQDLKKSAELVVLEGREYLVPKLGLNKAKLQLCQNLEVFHRERPMEKGVAVDDLAIKHNIGDDILFRAALSVLLKEQSLRIHSGSLSRAGHRPTVSSQVQQQWMLFSNILRKGGLQVPLLSEIEKESGLNVKQLSALIKPALKSGDIVQLSKRRYMLKETQGAIEKQLAELALQCECFTVIDVKNKLGLGRNLTVEVLEYFDSINVTRRKDTGREFLP